MEKFLKIKLFFLILFFTPFSVFAQELTGDDIFDIKRNAFALYNTNHINEAHELLDKIPDNKKDEETCLILANIEEDKGNIDKAITLLNASIVKNPEFYKAYYNLGCIFMKKKVYSLAVDNFELAVKYNKENPYGFYNLGCAYLNTGEYKKAKKNFIKAVYLKGDEKTFYYNLAYANKKLGKEKDAQKIIDYYNERFLKAN